jgi:alkanesulfonate monooxygenase SsuD/methylene tetrahydromethanopterin reductase-like flavin-dependent oxidoreductase (luciferase family)
MPLSFSVGIYQTAPVAEMIRLTRLAEDLGFETAWLGDSQCLWREAYVTLGALAVSTRSIRLGTSVTNPVTRHLTVTASALCSLAELTGGRVLLGIGRGETAVKLAGGRRATLAELRDAVRDIRALCQGTSVRIDGVEARLEYAAMSPTTIPVYLPGLAPRMLALAGEVADGVLLTVGAEPRYVRAGLAALDDGLRAAGRSRAAVRVAARVPCSVSDEADPRRHVRSSVALAVLQAKPFAFDDEDRSTIEKIRQAYDYHRHLSLDAAHGDLVPDRLVDKFAIAGSPTECLERVRGLAACAIDEVNIVLVSPTPDRLLRTFATRIMERL